MGVFEKLKNALFEEEYVEIEEKPKKSKSIDFFKDKKNSEKPIAKKVVLPEKKELKNIDLDDDSLIDEDFDVEPLTKPIESNDFEVDDNDVCVENNRFEKEVIEEPEIVKVLEKDEDLYRNDFAENNNNVGFEDKKSNDNYGYQQKIFDKPAYGMSSSKVSTPDYGGAYEKKDSRTHFTPSPIISPIYGILDKNYKKDDVVAKSEVKVSSYTRRNVSLDDVRKKAYGNLSDDFAREFIGDKDDEVVEEKNVQDDEADEDNNLLVDLNDDKPSVKEVTMGDALEYFHDLGLEYNVDYVDATKNSTTKNTEKNELNNKNLTRVSRLDQNDYKDDNSENESSNEKNSSESDDNLFDLIDSMYKENE